MLEQKKRPPRPASKPNPQDIGQEVAPAPSTASERQLTIGEIDALRLFIQRQIESCWDVPAGARNAANLAVKVSFSLRPDGSLAGLPVVQDDVQAEKAGGPFCRAAAESARRAVLKCAPLTGLPTDRYEYWRDVTLNLHPGPVLSR